MKYLEDLPELCPPAKAIDIGIQAFRVIPLKDPTLNDFKSHAARKKPVPPGVDPCRWASCSLCVTKEQAINLAGKLPKLRGQGLHIVKVKIQQGSGKSVINRRKTHIDFWPFAGFNPLKAIAGPVEKVNGA